MVRIPILSACVGIEQFQLGTLVLHRGRRYVVRGYSRLSGDEQCLDLEDQDTGLRLTVPADEALVTPLRLVPDPPDAPPQPNA
jgi:hypothetical protein